MSLRDQEIPNGAPEAFARHRAADPYTPDVEAYRIDPKNDPQRELVEAFTQKKPLSLTLRCRAHDGRVESFELDSTASYAYLEADPATRDEFKAMAIRERRVAVCVAAIARLREAGQAPSPNTLKPDEEAYLRELGALRDRVVLQESEDGPAVTAFELVEDFFDGGSYGGAPYTQFQAPTSLDVEYRPQGSPAMQQLFINDVWDMQAKAWWAWHHDPIAKRGIAIRRNFVLGRGVQVVCDDEQVQAIVDAFEKREKMGKRLKGWVTSLSRDGELVLRKFKPGDGTIYFRKLPSETIVEVITDAEDSENELAIVQRYQTRYQQFSFTTYPQSTARWIHRELPKWEYLRYKINASEEDVRGRSDLFSVFGWLKRMRDYFDSLVQKEQAMAAYQWDYEIDGGPADIQAFQNSLPAGKPDSGSYFIHNSKAKVQAVSPARTSGSGGNPTYDALLNHIANGFGFSGSYLGSGGHENRASALVASEPGAKEFEDFQDTVADLYTDVIAEVVREARIHGKIENATKGYGFRLAFPAIIKADAQTRQTMIDRAEAMGHLAKETAASLVYGELDLEGVNYADEKTKMVAESLDMNASVLNVITQDLQQVAKGPAAVPGGGDDSPGPGLNAPATPEEKGEMDTDAGNASPTSAVGAAKIRRDLGREGARRVTMFRNGHREGIVILP